MADADDPFDPIDIDSQPDSEPDLNHSFKFNNEIIKQVTDEITTTHWSLPMLKRPNNEAGPSS